VPVPTGVATTVPTQPVAACGQLVVELSTEAAVGSGSVPGPPAAAPAPDSVEILGQGSFGIEEGAPVGWVAAWVGDGVTSVGLSSGGDVVDTMAPSSGIVVLAMPGDPDLSGATVVAVSQTGGPLSSVPADQAPATESTNGCTAGSTGPTTTTTTTTQPTANSTPPTDPPPTSTTTTTTTTAPPTPKTATTTPIASPPPTPVAVPSTPPSGASA
jgi:hypothetical protein